MEKNGNNSRAAKFGIDFRVEKIIIRFLQTKIELSL